MTHCNLSFQALPVSQDLFFIFEESVQRLCGRYYPIYFLVERREKTYLQISSVYTDCVTVCIANLFTKDSRSILKSRTDTVTHQRAFAGTIHKYMELILDVFNPQNCMYYEGNELKENCWHYLQYVTHSCHFYHPTLAPLCILLFSKSYASKSMANCGWANGERGLLHTL